MKNYSFSVQELQKKLEYYCSYQERCHYEVYNKLKGLTRNNDDINQVITKLIGDGYLNETRFSKEFTIGKFNHKNWGRIRIKLELKKRKISTKNIEIGLNELDDGKYLKKLEDLFKRKLEIHSYKMDIYSKKKIFDYFNYRGWEKDLIFKKLNSLNEKK
jgi:regulatory protein|tara:strand:- start:11 stop:487 length:477 start_codon:yes stop_codon:yes gene_type:complete